MTGVSCRLDAGVTAVWRLMGLIALACFVVPASAQSGFRSSQPSPRLEYWQQRVITIDRELSERTSVESARLLFMGDSITDFWLLGNSPWHRDVRYGRALWDEICSSRAMDLLHSPQASRPSTSLSRQVRASRVMLSAMYPGLSPEFAFAIGGEVRPGEMSKEHLAQMAR